MDDSTLFTVIMVGLAAYALTCAVQFIQWFLRLWTDADDETLIECPFCGEIEFQLIAHGSDFDEFECNECGHYGTF